MFRKWQKSWGWTAASAAKFLNASIGFGGSCFKKDILNLVYLCRVEGLEEVADYVEKVVQINEYQKERFVLNMLSAMFNTLAGKKNLPLRICLQGRHGRHEGKPGHPDRPQASRRARRGGDHGSAGARERPEDLADVEWVFPTWRIPARPSAAATPSPS